MTSEILRNEECNPNLLKKKGLELLDAGKTNEAVECFSKGLRKLRRISRWGCASTRRTGTAGIIWG